MQDYSMFKAGYVAIIGKPNAGKSTLLNNLLDIKLSIVTHKAQTTRKKVLGILSNDESQIIFIDTPGLIDPKSEFEKVFKIDPKYDLQKKMMEYLKSALEDADIILYLLDVSDERPGFEKISEDLKKMQKPVILAITKMDTVERKTVLPLLEKYWQLHLGS